MALRHVDDWLGEPTLPSNAGEMYAKFVIEYFRRPAWFLVGASGYMAWAKLFCDYQGQRYRVTGASRLGDLFLARDFTRRYGYAVRAYPTQCTNWSCEPDRNVLPDVARVECGFAGFVPVVE